MSLNDNTENKLENGETQEVNENIVSSEIENNIEDNQNDSEIIPADETNAELDDIEESNADIDEENSKAKKHKNRTLVVAASIFAVTALSFGAWYTFFNNDVSGVWATDVEFTDNSGNTKTAVMKFEFGNKEKMSFFDNEKSYFSDKESNFPSAKMIMVEEVGLVGITRQPLMLTRISYSFISQHIKVLIPIITKFLVIYLVAEH